jgi:hypothetical protein
MARKKPRSTKEFYKMLKGQTATFWLASGENVLGEVIAIDKDFGDLIVEKADGHWLLIPEHSFTLIETVAPPKRPRTAEAESGDGNRETA